MKSENEIPKFDLARQIMSTQRKFSAGKRIAPKKKDIRPQTQDLRLQTTNPSKEHDTQPAATLPMHGGYSSLNTNHVDKIISDIVARDIHNLRKR